MVTTSPNFKTAVEIILSHEGGYVNHPKDPGGETKYGISKRAYPDLNIKDMTRDQAKEIYYRDYWQKIRGDKLPFGVALMLFDMAVNIGVVRTIKMLQKAVNQKQDGVFGDHTLMATAGHSKGYIIETLALERLDYYASLATWKDFGKGWTRRTIEILSTGLLVHDMI